MQRKQGMQEGQTEKEEMRQQQRMKVMKDMTKKIRSKGRVDVNNSWWVSALLVTDCENAWLHPGWADIVLRWCDWLFEMKENDEVKRMDVDHQKTVSCTITSFDGSTCFLHKTTEPTAWRGVGQFLKKRKKKMRSR